MFHVFRLDDEGNAILLQWYYHRTDAANAVEIYSDKYPHAYVDYVYKDV